MGLCEHPWNRNLQTRKRRHGAMDRILEEHQLPGGCFKEDGVANSYSFSPTMARMIQSNAQGTRPKCPSEKIQPTPLLNHCRFGNAIQCPRGRQSKMLQR